MLYHYLLFISFLLHHLTKDSKPLAMAEWFHEQPTTATIHFISFLFQNPTYTSNTNWRKEEERETNSNRTTMRFLKFLWRIRCNCKIESNRQLILLYNPFIFLIKGLVINLFFFFLNKKVGFWCGLINLTSFDGKSNITCIAKTLTRLLLWGQHICVFSVLWSNRISYVRTETHKWWKIYSTPKNHINWYLFPWYLFPILCVHLALMKVANLFYYSAYFYYYSWAPLHFLVLFMGLTILFQLTFIFIYSTFSKISRSQMDPMLAKLLY